MSYPTDPQSWPDPASTPGPPPQQPAQPPPPVAPVHPGAGPPGYGYGGYAPPGYPAPGYPAPPKTNGLAVGSLVTSIASAVSLVCAFCLAPLAIVSLLGGATGAILGFVARRQVRERGEQGDGMALAGAIVGLFAAVLSLLVIVVLVIWVGWAFRYDSSSFS